MSTIEPLTQERRRQLTRDHLLAAAAQVFAERGFHGATLDEVARVAGFTKGAVYSNFKSKDDLFLALFKTNYEREMAQIVSTLESSTVPPVDRLSDFVPLIPLGDEQDTKAALLYVEFWLYAARNSEAQEQMAAIDDEAVRSLAELLRTTRAHDLTPLEDPERVAQIIHVLFHGISFLRATRPELVDSELLRVAIEFVARGLGEIDVD